MQQTAGMLQNDSSYVKNMILQIAKRGGFYKNGMMDEESFHNFLNKNPKIRDAIKTALGITFVTYKDDNKDVNKDVNKNVDKDVNKDVDKDVDKDKVPKHLLEINKLKEITTIKEDVYSGTYPNENKHKYTQQISSDYKWEEYCDLDYDQTKMVSAYKCVGPDGIRVDDDMCNNKKPNPTNKCNSSKLGEIRDID